MTHPIVAHIPSLRRYARALKGNRPDADDLVQDALERAYSKWHLWNRGAKLRPWLFAIMHNVFVNQAKLARNSFASVALDEAATVAVPARQDLVGDALDVATALQKLPPLQREVLLLVALEDFAYADAATALGIPIGTVMSRLASARAKVRELMSDLREHPAAQVKP